MRLRLDRGVHRHSGDELSSHPSPNKELIRVQIDDDTIQKYNHHHTPRPSHRRTLQTSTMVSANNNLVDETLSVPKQADKLNPCATPVMTTQIKTYTSLRNALSTLHYTRLEKVRSSEDIRELVTVNEVYNKHKWNKSTYPYTCIQRLTLSSDRVPISFNLVLLCTIYPSSIVNIN
jgi:hypothetical protein